MYGKNCSLSCGHCFKLEQCHNMNGTCMNGCDSGYNGFNCAEGNFIVYIATKKTQTFYTQDFFLSFNSECDDKHFGPNCIEMCNATCKSCNKSTGICDIGCHPGWRGLFCEDSMFINMQTIIIKGFFGLIYFVYFRKMFFKTYFQKENINTFYLPFRIKQKRRKVFCFLTFLFAPTLLEHKMNQYIIIFKYLYVTFNGESKIYCIEACNQRKYGENCSMPCGHCVDSEQCHHINGICMNGCDSGFAGINCTDGEFITPITKQKRKMRCNNHNIFICFVFNLECDDNYYGPNCIKMCNTGCKSCNKSTGICDNGCNPGWRGVFCHEGYKHIKQASAVLLSYKYFHILENKIILHFGFRMYSWLLWRKL